MKAFVETLALLLIRGLGLLPLGVLQEIGAVVGRLASYLPIRARQTARRNIELCFPELTQAQQNQLVRASLIETGKLALEMPFVWTRPLSSTLERVHVIEGAEAIDRALARGQGVICLAPHVGNWEVLNLVLSSRYAMTAFYAPSAWPKIDDLIRTGRMRAGGRVAPTNAQGIRQLIKALRNGEVVGVLPDQVPEQGLGAVMAPFLQRHAITATLSTRLGMSTEATALCGSALRDQNGFFTVRFSEVSGDWQNEVPDIAAAAVNDAVEACLKQAVPQYQWTYKRFKHSDPMVDLYKSKVRPS